MGQSRLKIAKDRRDYNTWVVAETLEDYALRFAPISFRKWPEWLVANTASGGLSFLALEAMGGSLAISYGFANSFWAILVVSVILFLVGLPIAYYAAKHNVDIDLLTRGAGFGYIGSTITSLIYASFTFIFFALEAAVMAQALELYFQLPLPLGYVVCSLVIIPLVFFGVTLINQLHLWTQPLWLLCTHKSSQSGFPSNEDRLKTSQPMNYSGHSRRGLRAIA
jgi:purine-cytosine permease-like protein